MTLLTEELGSFPYDGFGSLNRRISLPTDPLQTKSIEKTGSLRKFAVLNLVNQSEYGLQDGHQEFTRRVESACQNLRNRGEIEAIAQKRTPNPRRPSFIENLASLNNCTNSYTARNKLNKMSSEDRENNLQNAVQWIKSELVS